MIPICHSYYSYLIAFYFVSFHIFFFRFPERRFHSFCHFFVVVFAAKNLSSISVICNDYYIHIELMSVSFIHGLDNSFHIELIYQIENEIYSQ